MTQDELARLLDEYGVPEGDPDERLLMVLVFWQENNDAPES